MFGRYAWTMLRRWPCSVHGGRVPMAGSQAAAPPTRPANGIWPTSAQPLAAHRLHAQAARPRHARLARSRSQSSHPVRSCRRGSVMHVHDGGSAVPRARCDGQAAVARPPHRSGPARNMERLSVVVATAVLAGLNKCRALSSYSRQQQLVYCQLFWTFQK